MYKTLTFYTIKANTDNGIYAIYLVEGKEINSSYSYDHVKGECLEAHTPDGMTVNQVLEMSDKEPSDIFDIDVLVIDGVIQDNLVDRAYFTGLRLALLHSYEDILTTSLELRVNLSFTSDDNVMNRMLSNIRKHYKNFHPDGL